MKTKTNIAPEGTCSGNPSGAAVTFGAVYSCVPLFGKDILLDLPRRI